MSIIHQDQRDYYRFTTKSRLDKSINSLLGLIQGIAVDAEINRREVDFLNLWLDDHREIRHRHPFTELYPVVQQAILDGVLTLEEKEDILWLCEKLTSRKYYDEVTADMQILHAILAGIASDGSITAEELRGLSAWLQSHEHLRTCWPYDEVDSLIVAALKDKKIDSREHEVLKGFFSEFLAILDDRTITAPHFSKDGTMLGICAVTPSISFKGQSFCFTGSSARYSRQQISDVVVTLGGQVVASVSSKLDYLVIGAEGNPCWAYACYGRKVEKAVELRRTGARLQIVHENDFHDAVGDLS